MIRLSWAKQALKNDYRTIKRRVKYGLSKKRNQRRAIYVSGGLLILALCVLLAVSQTSSSAKSIKYQNQLKERQYRLQSLSGQLKQVHEEKTKTEAEVKAKAAHEAELQKQIDNLNAQLSAKRQSLLARAANAVAPTAYAATPPSSGCGIYHTGNITVDTLINRESGGNTCAMNAGGCFGILQACPGYPLQSACGGNGACQLAWFEANKLGRYGSWEAALAHSYATGWW